MIFDAKIVCRVVVLGGVCGGSVFVKVGEGEGEDEGEGGSVLL